MLYWGLGFHDHVRSRGVRFSLLNTLWPRGESLWGHGVITHVDVHIRSASGSRSLEMCIQIRDWVLITCRCGTWGGDSDFDATYLLAGTNLIPGSASHGRVAGRGGRGVDP